MKITRFLKNSIGTAMLAGALLLAAPHSANASVFISVGIAPPPIPVYVQPPIPGDGYIWTPGYWAWTGEGYEWVDGAWVSPPYVGALWTPGYWGWGNGGYFWNAGYWGPSVGYYGGINYGFGYFGVGFYGGYWNHRHFCYNRVYNNFGGHRDFRYVYDRPVHGFNGRPGGSSFTSHPEHNFQMNRAAYINGRNFNHGGFNNNQHGFAENTRHGIVANQQHNFSNGNRGVVGNEQRGFPNGNRPNNFGTNHEVYNGAHSFNQGNNAPHNFSQSAPRSYAQPTQRSFGGQNRSFGTAPASRPNFGGNGGTFHGNMAGGGGFHGNMGSGSHGGGGFHGGGGGGGNFHGGRR